MYTQIDRCRICGNAHLERVLDLGEQMLTGVFPRTRDASITTGPLRLVKCTGGAEVCGLLQMEHSYDLGEMYGENYGYRSGLNPSMVAHLNRKVELISGLVQLDPGDLVIDIGSNDATTLRAYPQPGLRLVGVDPTGVKFREYYPPHIDLIADFFSADLVRERCGGGKAKVVTSFSMFYDLEAPMAFMRQVHDVLADDGIWVFEQSYMPSMLAANSYDTVCHEHLEFYGLTQIKWMADRVGLTITDVEFNDVNGGSFSVVARKTKGDGELRSAIARILADEASAGLHTLEPYLAFQKRVEASRDELQRFVRKANSDGKVIGALGASTKGNVILQYCGFNADDL
jgi:NDP-4-keto-2,6-dideoxyhexose 3-C-methyltransferase